MKYEILRDGFLLACTFMIGIVGFFLTCLLTLGKYINTSEGILGILISISVILLPFYVVKKINKVID